MQICWFNNKYWSSELFACDSVHCLWNSCSCISCIKFSI